MKLFLTNHSQRELNQIPNAIAKNIIKHIVALFQNPYPVNSKKLQGQENYRIRIGSFRVIYTIDKKKKEITVLRVADRKTIYR